MNINLDKLLKERELPELKSREEMLDILCREEYGFLPPDPTELTFTVEEKCIPNFCAGNAVANRVTAHCVINGKEFSFPFIAVIPTKDGKHPFFIHINFRPDVPDRYMPSEELVDNGFAVFSIYYDDVTSDDGDFTNGLAGVLFPDGKRGPHDPGKIAMWAWAAQRVLDYAETLDCLDLDAAVVCGHSRLGKTALFTSATDTRFRFAYSNNSGCSGDALARGTTGETVAQIVDRFPFWFCENYKQYVNNESNMPYDQHYLLASIAPRFVCVGSASKDWWADPNSQFMTCVAASPAFEKGFVCDNKLPQVDDKYFDGHIGYHMREGLHYFSRKDWNRLIEFVNKHR
ncbi:MAG: hypothetical protein IJZ88_00030 [Clostridia bacterium]|nr:hypothetical protein [Clostridia bacterium]